MTSQDFIILLYYNNFKLVFKFSLKPSFAFPEIKVSTADNKMMAFDWIGDWSDEVRSEILEVINGTKDKIEGGGSFKPALIYSIDSFIVYFDDKPLLRIRGWGYLTGSGVGGLNLPSELANNLSTSFAEYIVDRLNGGK